MSKTAFIRAAATDIGYRETGVNLTKYWQALMPQWQGQPWCAAAVSEWLILADELDAFNGSPIFYCPTIEAIARSKGRWFTSGPQAGDIVLYSFGASVAIHVGVVEKVLDGGWIQTIEGNTSSGNAGSQNNGDGVYRRKRSTSWGIRGYYRPAFKADPKPPAPKPAAGPTPQQATPKNLEIDGTLGALTITALNRLTGRGHTARWDDLARKLFQKWLGVAQDGVIGRKTVLALQKRIGAAQDGDWGPKTTAALQRYLNAR